MTKFARFQILYNIAYSRRAREASNFYLYDFVHACINGEIVITPDHDYDGGVFHEIVEE